MESLREKENAGQVRDRVGRNGPDRREKLLGRLRPEVEMEIRQQLISRYGLS